MPWMAGTEQYDNALIIQFDGGYGMFCDPMTEEQFSGLQAIICHECAHALCALMPWMSRIIDPYRSHAHSVDKIPGLLAEGHRGWDLEDEYQ